MASRPPAKAGSEAGSSCESEEDWDNLPTVTSGNSSTTAEVKGEALCHGPLIVEGAGGAPQSCALFEDRMEIEEEDGLQWPIDSIEEVDILENGFTIRQKRNRTTNFFIPPSASVGLADWLRALELAVAQRKMVAEAPRKKAAASPRKLSFAPGGPETVIIVPHKDRKLREVFDRCGADVVRAGCITTEALAAACRSSALIADFFGIGRDVEAGVSEMLQVLRRTQQSDARTDGVDWEDFKAFYRLWAPDAEDAVEAAAAAEALHEGSLRIVSWPSEAAAGELKSRSQWALDHVVFDPATGIATLKEDLQYQKRRFSLGTPRSDQPTAEFEYPEEAAAALEELAKIFKRFHGPLYLVYRFRKPLGGFQNTAHHEWMSKLCANRTELLRVELEEHGVPPDCLFIRLEDATDDNGPTVRFEFDLSCQVRHFSFFLDRIEVKPTMHQEEDGIACRSILPTGAMRGVRLVDDGFALTFATEEALEVQILDSDVIAPWVEALRTIANSKQSESTTPSPLANASSSSSAGVTPPSRPRPPTAAATPPAPPTTPPPAAVRSLALPLAAAAAAEESAEEELERRLAQLPQQVLMHGPLDFHIRGGTVPRHGVLFPDRLEAWDSAADISASSEPPVCIPVSEIKGLDSTVDGLTLNLGSLRVSIDVPDKRLRLWSQALLLLIVPTQVLPEAIDAAAAARDRSPRRADAGSAAGATESAAADAGDRVDAASLGQGQGADARARAAPRLGGRCAGGRGQPAAAGPDAPPALGELGCLRLLSEHGQRSGWRQEAVQHQLTQGREAGSRGVAWKRLGDGSAVCADIATRLDGRGRRRDLEGESSRPLGSAGLAAREDGLAEGERDLAPEFEGRAARRLRIPAQLLAAARRAGAARGGGERPGSNLSGPLPAGEGGFCMRRKCGAQKQLLAFGLQRAGERQEPRPAVECMRPQLAA